MKKIILIVVVLVIAIGGFYAYTEYNRTNKDLKSVKADFTTDAATLIASFEKDSSSAKKYVDRLIAVSGHVKAIDAEGNPVVIALGEPGQMSSVQCSMDSAYVSEYKTIKEGDQLTIKGMCTGGRTEELFGTDVILNRCVVENKK
jgi:hypothetical protein